MALLGIRRRASLKLSPRVELILGIVCAILLHSGDCSNWTGTECTVEHNICTLPSENSLRFFILGDWGGQERYPYKSRLQEETALTLNNASQTLRPHFYLSTGDNFYERGVRNVKDKRFNATFDSMYTYGKAERIPWYITAGNHDYYGSVQAQLDYAKLNPRWIYPSLYYPIRYSFGKPSWVSSETTVDIFVLDTILLCGGTVLGGWNPKTEVYIRPSDRPTGPKNVTAANEAFDWLENKLRNSRADFIFIMGHYPVYSTGVHGNTECLRERLPDMLIKYRVNAYIAGHDHQLQHLTMIGPDGWIVHHVISGAASRFDRRYSPPSQVDPRNLNVVTSMYVFPNAKESTSNGGFVFAEVKGRLAVFEYYRSDGAYLYAFTTRRRN